MEFKNHIPIYIQIIDCIKKDIVLSKRQAGDKLDSVRDFAMEMKVNPNTIQKAYQEMERMNLAFTKRGVGTFIIERDTLKTELMHEMSEFVIHDFITKMTEIGFSNSEITEKLNDAMKKGEK